ncbi:hypothetical protein ACFLZT_04150 [Thermodesulfobacteriota bacterium]
MIKRERPGDGCHSKPGLSVKRCVKRLSVIHIISHRNLKTQYQKNIALIPYRNRYYFEGVKKPLPKNDKEPDYMI